MEAANIGSGGSVQDTAFGTGRWTALIKEAGATVIGVDDSQGMVDHAPATSAGVEFQVGGIEELAFGEDEFDLVCAANSVQYAADLDTALRELGRVCKLGGPFRLSAPRRSTRASPWLGSRCCEPAK